MASKKSQNKKLSSKMGAKESSGFPMKTLMFLMVIFSSVFVALDVKSNGSWSESTTAKFMKTSGVCHYSHLAWNKTTEGVQWVDTKLTTAYPEHYKATKGYVSPYFLLLKDVGTIAYNVGENAYEGIAKGYPIVVESIETYAPGLQEKTSTVVKSTVSNSVYYFNASVEYLRNEVFVGQLSPENIKKVVLVAVDTTQQKASEAFHWVKEKVQTTIK